MFYLILIIVAAIILVGIVVRRLPYLRTHRLGMEINRPRSYGFKTSWFSELWHSVTSFFQGFRSNRLKMLDRPLIPPSSPRIPPYASTRPISPLRTQEEDKDEVSSTVAHPEDFWQEELYQPSPLEVPSQGLITRRGEAQKISQELVSSADEAFRKKDYKEAEKFYLQAATKDPNNARIYNRLGVIYLHTKNYKDAVEAFRGALKFDDRVASRHFNLALAYLGKRDYRSAEKVLREAIKLDPTNDKYRKTLETVHK